MLENKTTRIEIRITEKEKQLLKEYCKQKNITISKLFREFLYKLLKKESDD